MSVSRSPTFLYAMETQSPVNQLQSIQTPLSNPSSLASISLSQFSLPYESVFNQRLQLSEFGWITDAIVYRSLSFEHASTGPRQFKIQIRSSSSLPSPCWSWSTVVGQKRFWILHWSLWAETVAFSTSQSDLLLKTIHQIHCHWMHQISSPPKCFKPNHQRMFTEVRWSMIRQPLPNVSLTAFLFGPIKDALLFSRTFWVGLKVRSLSAPPLSCKRPRSVRFIFKSYAPWIYSIHGRFRLHTLLRIGNKSRELCQSPKNKDSIIVVPLSSRSLTAADLRNSAW